MLQPFYVEPTFDSPQVILDYEKGIFSIKGRSLPENAIKFYNPIFEWLNNYIDQPLKKTDFILSLEYFSSSSAKQVSKLLSLLEKLSDFSEVTIKWCYPADDIDLKMFGEKLSKIIKLKFEFVAIES